MPYSYMRDVWAVNAPRDERLSTWPWFTRAPHPGLAERGSGWMLHSSLLDKLSAERHLHNAAFRQLVRVVTSVLVDVNLRSWQTPSAWLCCMRRCFRNTPYPIVSLLYKA